MTRLSLKTEITTNDLVVNNGSADNANNGDKLRNAFGKLIKSIDRAEANFVELYAQQSAEASDRLVNGSAEVVLGSNGVLTFPNGETLVSQPSQLYFHKDDNDFVGEIVLQADGVGIQATHPTLGNSLINISTNGATILINDNEWGFDRLGTLSVPDVFPVTFTATVDEAHCDGELTLTGDAWHFEVTFQADVYGEVSTQITNDTPWSENPGYTEGMTFTFTEADHGIPDYTFTLELTDIQNPGPFMYTTNLAASIPPSMPHSITSTESLTLHGHNSVVIKTGENIHEERFIFRGRNLTLPQSGDIKDYLGNSVLINLGNLEIDESTILTAADTSIVIQTSERTRVTAACYIANGDEFVADIEFNDDIIVVQPGWTVEIDEIVYTVASVDDSVGNMYKITATGATFVQGTEYTFYSPDATAYEWEFRANGGISGPGGVILTNETADLGEGATYRELAIELPTQDGLNETRLVFNNSGKLILPGELDIGGQTYTNSAIIWGSGSGAIINNVPLDDYFVIATNTSIGTPRYWKFGTDGNLRLPVGGDIQDSNGQSLLGGGGGTGALELQAVPATKYGTTGDTKGMVAIDSNTGDFYFCITDYTDGLTSIWRKTSGTDAW